MRNLLTIDKRVAIYGNKKSIEQTEITLLKNIPELPTLTESRSNNSHYYVAGFGIWYVLRWVFFQ